MLVTLCISAAVESCAGLLSIIQPVDSTRAKHVLERQSWLKEDINLPNIHRSPTHAARTHTPAHTRTRTHTHKLNTHTCT